MTEAPTRLDRQIGLVRCEREKNDIYRNTFKRHTKQKHQGKIFKILNKYFCLAALAVYKEKYAAYELSRKN